MERDIFKKQFQRYFNIFWSDLKSYWFLLPAIALFLYLSLTNFISHSELWSIASGQRLGSTDWDALATYVRPLFYLILKIPFLIPIGNVEHLQLARGLFGLLALLNFFLFYRLILSLNWSRSTAALFCCLLFSFQVFFSHFYRVRSDFLALSFFLLALPRLLNPKLIQLGRFRFDPSIPLFVFLMFLSTPKSIYWVAWLAFLYILTNRKKLPLTRLAFNSLYWIAAPSVFLVIAVQIGGLIYGLPNNVYAHALNFYAHSFESSLSADNFSPVIRSLQINFVQYLAIFAGLLLYFARFRKGQYQTTIVLFFLALATLLFHPDRWDYFIAALLPFLALPLLFVIESLRKKVLLKVSFVILLFWLPWHMTYYKNWWHSNKTQFGHTDHLSLLMLHFPDWRIFDSTGIIPRANNFLFFYGPSDPNGNFNTTEMVRLHKPEIVVYTPKVRLGGPDLIIVLYKNYVEVNPGFWVLNSKLAEYNELDFPSWNYNLGLSFGYDHLPEVRYFTSPPY